MPKRAAIALAIVFVVTRLLSGWLGYNTDVYKGDTNVAGDVVYYHYHANRIVDGGEPAYQEPKDEFPPHTLEYPPGSLLVIIAPYWISSDADTYRLLFIVMMIIVDALGAVALLILGRRWRSRWGVWAWVFLIPFLGPIAHLRLDLVPAVLTIWAFERATVNRWLEVGAAIGIGTAVKLYPIALLPILFIVAWRRRELLIGAALPLIAVLIPHIGKLPELYDSVVGYQTGRGVQVESTWGLLLLVLSLFGLVVSVAYSFGAYHVESSLSGLFDTLASLASLAGAGFVYWLSHRHLERHDLRRASVVAFGLMTILLGASAVWSPQFLVWVIALAAVMMSARGEPSRHVAYVLAAAGVVSQIAYPFFYNDLLAGNALLSGLLLARNLAVVAVGIACLKEVFPNLRPKRAELAVEGA
jgi:Glycosyltransferase family 87